MPVELDVSFIVPSFGSTLRCRPLLSGVPRAGSPTSLLLLRHSDVPPPRAAFATQFRFPTESAGPPKFLGNPRHACSDRRSRRSREAGLRGGMPLPLASLMLPSTPVSASASTTTISGFIGAACMLAVYASWPRLPVCCLRPRKTRFQLAALPWLGGNRTRWVANQVSSSVWLHMGSSWTGLAWRTTGTRTGERRDRYRDTP